MKPLTQQLVRLLADDVTGRMIDALRVAPQTAPELESLAGSSHKKVADTLEVLHAHGIIGWAPRESNISGRPSRVWHLDAAADLDEFERACDDFKAGLLRRQLAETTTKRADEAGR